MNRWVVHNPHPAVDLSQPKVVKALDRAVKHVWRRSFSIRANQGSVVSPEDLRQVAMLAVWLRSEKLGRDLDPPEVFLTAKWAAFNEINRVNDWNRVGGTGRLPEHIADSDRKLKLSVPDSTQDAVHRNYEKNLMNLIPQVGLSTHQRRTLVAFLQGRGCQKSLALEMGVTKQAVSQSYRRALEKIRAYFEERGYRKLHG